MARKFLTPIDLNANEIQNVKAQSIAGDHGSPGNGQFWYDSSANAWKAYINGATRALTWATGSNPTAETVGATVSVGTAVDAARSDHRHAMPGNATSGVDGFMPGTDKTKLDAATASPTVSTLAMRDAAGRMQAVSPSAADDVAIKSYVDAMAVGLDIHASVRCATAGAALSTIGTTPVYNATGGASARGQITWTTGPTAVDGVTLVNADRILVKDEGSGTHASNGIYVRTSANVWDRATDFDADADVSSGAFMFVEEGTLNADSGFVLSTNGVIVVGGASGTALTFSQFSGAGQITAGAGLTKTGNTLDVGAGTGITVAADTVAVTTNGISNALLRQGAALSVIGVTGNATANVADIAAVNDGEVLRRSGTALGFGAISLSTAAAVTGALGYANGGTGQSAYAAGDLVYASAINTLAKRTIGSTGDLLTVVGGVPAWQSPATTGLCRKYAVDVGGATSQVITHNLNTLDVQVSLYLKSGSFDEQECDIEHTGVNSVTLRFSVAPSAAALRCVVTG